MINLTIKDANIAPHLDIEKYIRDLGNGVITFNLRVNNTVIADFQPTQYVNVKKEYFSNGAQEFLIKIEKCPTPTNNSRS
jgi:hypothetical protein